MDKRSLKRRAAVGVVAIALALVASDGAAGGSRVKRVGNLYQWVDTSGRVVYGDSPPTVTESRQVDGRSRAGVQRSFPDRRESQQQASVVGHRPAAKPSATATLNADQLAALARLNPDLAQALAQGAPAATLLGNPGDNDASSGGAIAVTPPTLVRAAALATVTATAPTGTRLALDAVAAGESPLGPLAEPEADASSVTIANNTSSVSLGLTTATVVDVAHSEPRLIETELSEKELVRLRRRSLAIGERRFLERLKSFQTGAGSSD